VPSVEPALRDRGPRHQGRLRSVRRPSMQDREGDWQAVLPTVAGGDHGVLDEA
jgi:hypothetical protein